MSREHGPLLVYVGRERTLVRWWRVAAHAGMTLFVVSAGAAFAILRQPSNLAGWTYEWPFLPYMVVGAWFGLVLLAVLQMVRIRNRIVAARELVSASWALIEIATIKRADLLPALIAVVEEAAANEREVLNLLDGAREQSFHAHEDASRTDLASSAMRAHRSARTALEGLQALRERHPSIDTSPNFEHLFNELRELENSVAAAQRYYTTRARCSTIECKRSPTRCSRSSVGRHLRRLSNSANSSGPTTEFHASMRLRRCDRDPSSLHEALLRRQRREHRKSTASDRRS